MEAASLSVDDEAAMMEMFSKKKKNKTKNTDKDTTLSNTDIPKDKEEPEDSYEELLDRIYSQMNKGSKVEDSRLKLKPPKTVRDGKKKTAWINFMSTAKALNRSEDHLSLFINAELGAVSSVTQDGALLIRGVFQTLKIEICLKKYIEQYVKCGMCRQMTTILSKNPETRLTMMSCSHCGACRSVANIVAGFHATTKADRKKAKD